MVIGGENLGLFNFNKNKQNNKSKRKMFDGFYSQQINIPPAMSTGDYLQSYGEIGWLFACVSKIAQNVADTEWKAYDKKDNVVESLALNLLKKPNPFASQYEFLQLHQMYMELIGKSFWYIAKDGIKRPKEIWLINPINMWVIPDKDNFIKGYIYKAGAIQVPLDTDEVLFFNYPDPLNPYSGISPAMAARNSLESDKYSGEWNRNTFYNDAEPPAILSFPDGLGDDEYDRLKNEWEDEHRGVDNAKKLAIVDGNPTYQQLSISPKDMDFANLRTMTRDEILGVYGVPKTLLGLTDNVNRATAETATYVFAQNTIKPRLRLLQDKINNELLPLFGEDIEIKFTDPVPDNKDFIKAVLDTQVDKTITKNEGRIILNRLLGLNLEPLADCDVIYAPISLQPLGTPMPAAQQKPEQDNSIDDDNSKSFKKNFDRTIRKKIAKQITKNNATRHDDFLKIAKPLEKEFNDTITSYLKDMQKDIVKEVENGSKDPVDLNKWNPILQKAVVSLYVDCFKTGGNAVVEEFKSIGNYIRKNVGVKFDVKNPNVQKKIQQKVSKITKVNEDTKQKIKDDIEQMYNSNEGFTIKDIAKKIASEDFPSFEKARCQCIAETETMTSLNQATNECYKQNADIIDGKAWLPTFNNTRPTHQAAGEDYSEDNAIPVTEQFQVGGYSCDCPGDDSLPAEEVVNCECCMMPVVKVD